jgi:hypothetical protein
MHCATFVKCIQGQEKRNRIRKQSSVLCCWKTEHATDLCDHDIGPLIGDVLLGVTNYPTCVKLLYWNCEQGSERAVNTAFRDARDAQVVHVVCNVSHFLRHTYIVLPKNVVKKMPADVLGRQGQYESWFIITRNTP